MNKYLTIFIMIAVILVWLDSNTLELNNPIKFLPSKDGVSSPLSNPDTPSHLYIVTAYCPCRKCCGKWANGYFANNEPVGGLAIAADPSIPFGTKMYIPGYGIAEVKDRGGAIKGNKLDVYFDTHRAAIEWGKRELVCRVLENKYGK